MARGGRPARRAARASCRRRRRGLPRAGARGTRVCQGRRGRAVPALRAARSLADRAPGRKHRRLHAAAGEHRRRPREPRLHAQRDGSPTRGRCARRSLRRPGRHRDKDDPEGHPGRLRGRSSPPAACSPPRGRARVHCDAETEKLVRRHVALVSQPAGERTLGELERLSTAGYRRLDELGLLDALGGSAQRFDRVGLADSPEYRLVCVFGARLRELPISRRLDRYARTLLAAEAPPDGSPRAIHRFRRRTEPWALDALAFVGRPDLRPAVEQARAADPAQPLLRGDELGLPPGPRSASCWN